LGKGGGAEKKRRGCRGRRPRLRREREKIEDI
jgi:hypothetical protein